MIRRTAFFAALSVAAHASAFGRGVSPYLPLNLEPELERQIEKVLILADKPVMTRPIAAAVVFDALPKACVKDALLCQEVGRALKRWMHPSGIGTFNVEASASNGSNTTVPNRYGLANDSGWQVSTSVYWQANDYALFTLGGVADGEYATPTHSLVSLGFSWAQLDIGYRNHALSPMTDSSMVMSTEAPTMPSITLSNYVPLTRVGLHYEIFAAQLSNSTQIIYGDGFTNGHPKVAGLHASIEPVSGWALGLNRVLQYGGGDRGGRSIGDVFDAFFQPSKFDNVNEDLGVDEQFGNQVASFTSRFLFPGRTPFSVYFEYAGEDTSRGKNYLLGNSALSAGIDFPRIARRFDLTYEVSEWQNSWYAPFIYRDGLANERHVLGHWGADQRVFGDGVGAQSHMIRMGWAAPFDGRAEVRYRTLANEKYTAYVYEHMHELQARYSLPVKQFLVGAEVTVGRDVFGENFSRFGAFFRLNEGSRGFRETDYSDPSSDDAAPGAELFVDVGVNANQVEVDLDDDIPGTKSGTEIAPHIGLGARRAVSERSDLGARLELDQVDGNLFVAVRALDYRYRFKGPLALGAFLGAARYDVATPAYGVYGGLGVQWRDIVRGGWDLGLDVRYAMKVARDDLLPTDPTGGRPDSFYDISSASLYLTKKF